MRVLVTGGGGYVGTALVTHLAAAGHAVTVVDPLPLGAEALLPAIGIGEVRLVRGSVTDTALMEATLPGHDAVVHLAALVGEAACAVDEDMTRAINVEAAGSIAAAASAAGIERFVFASTCSNYGVSDPGVLVDEDAPLRPLGLYAESKVEAEKRVRRAHDSAVILRFGTVCGPSPRMRFDLLVSELAREAVAGRELIIYAPEAWRPYLPMADLVRAVEHVVRTEIGSVSGSVFNVVAENCTKRDLVNIVQESFPEVAVALVDKAPDLRDYRVRGTRFEAATGFRMQSTVKSAFTETAQLLQCGVWSEPTSRRLTAVVPTSFQEHE